MQALNSTWYMDLYTSRYLINNRELFVKKLKIKSLNFTTANDQTL